MGSLFGPDTSSEMNTTEVELASPPGRPSMGVDDGKSDSSWKGRPRPRRPIYAAKACKECKRRKVKCDGKSPCRQCNRRETQCSYPERVRTREVHAPSDMSFVKQQLEILQQRLDLLVPSEGISGQTLRNRVPHGSTSTFSPRPESEFHASTPFQAGTQFSLGQQRHDYGSLLSAQPDSYISPQRMAQGLLSAASAQSLEGTAVESIAFPITSAKPLPSTLGKLTVTCHPLLSMSKIEAMRLVDTYEDECGSVYPLLDIGYIRSFTSDFYDEVASSQEPATWHTFQLDRSQKRPFHNLEMILAIALVIESGGPNHLSAALVDELEKEIDHRPSGTTVDVHFVEIMVLMSLYQFYRDEEMLAWRTIGLAARVALEIGLHLCEPPFASCEDGQERKQSNRLFWCIYVLDRHWSFMTGLPFALHEEDIDPRLPEPSDPFPYLLSSMIAYSRIGAKILKPSLRTDHYQQPGKEDDVSYLNYLIQQWQSSLAPHIRMEPGQSLVIEGLSSARNRLRVFFYLLSNHLRMLIHRKALLTAESIAADSRGARTAVDLAQDTVASLDRLHRTSGLYGSHRVFFNYFLYSALTLIFLAVYHAKTQFHEYCREKFHMALDLIGGHMANSNVAKKLWTVTKHLKVLGPEFGILPYLDENAQRENRPSYDVNGRFDTNLQPFNNEIISTSVPQNIGSQLNGTSSFTSGSVPYLANGYSAVNGDSLSSELSDFFQAFDPTRLQLPSSRVTDQRFPQISSPQLAQGLSRYLRHVF